MTIYNTEYSGLATICPPLWLIQHRALEPLAAVIAAYAAAAAVHWVLFFITVFLIGAYFHKIQFRLIRNYNIFTEHFYWVVCAARSVAEAQKICREIDPKCVFSFSYVGPPEDNEVEDKKAARRARARACGAEGGLASQHSVKGILVITLPISMGALFRQLENPSALLSFSFISAPCTNYAVLYVY